jgi:hypothetical protein
VKVSWLVVMCSRPRPEQNRKGMSRVQMNVTSSFSSSSGRWSVPKAVFAGLVLARNERHVEENAEGRKEKSRGMMVRECRR